MSLYLVVFLKAQKEFAEMQRWTACPVHLGLDNLPIQCHAFVGYVMGSCYVRQLTPSLIEATQLSFETRFSDSSLPRSRNWFNKTCNLFQVCISFHL